MAWKPPSVGSRARERMPRHAFLVPSQRKYPYKIRRGGRYVVSDAGLLAAYRRAILQKNQNVKNKARRLLNARRRRQGKPLIGK